MTSFQTCIGLLAEQPKYPARLSLLGPCSSFVCLCVPERRLVSSGRLGRLHDRTTQNQQHRASGLALVTAAIVLWNTVYLGRALKAARRSGDMIPDALLAHLAPLGWQHINLTGDYLWNACSNLGPDGFRPLRGIETECPAALAA